MTGRRKFSELRNGMAAGRRILEGARQALAFARGETAEGFVVHVPQRIDMAELLSRFDPEKHRRPLELDVEPAGTETKD